MQHHPLYVRFITRKWSPAVGGMETYCLRLTEQLAKHCHLEVAALPGKSNGQSPSGLKLVLFGLITGFRLATRRRPADVTHIADMAFWPLGAAARLSGKSGRIVLSAHGTDVSYAFRPGWRNKMYRSYLALCQRLLPDATFIANSSATKDALTTLGFGNVQVVPLASDPPNGAPARPPSSHVLFAGRIVKRKGLSWFVDSVLPLLPPEVTLRVAGPVWEETEASCLSSNRVQHLGTLDQESLKIEYSKATCVVVPNLDMKVAHLEGFGLVAPEAASAGAVVLAANTGGLTDAVLDGETGFLLPCEDAHAWADKIEEVFNWDMQTRATFLQTSQQACQRFYAWERVADQTLDAYRG